MSFIEMEQTIACQQMEIDDLHGKLKEAQAEIERLKGECLSLAIEATPGIQLAASQANEVQLREALEKIKDLCCKRIDPVKFKVTEQALSLPSDTAAIESIAQKAGEVMRERCAGSCSRNLIDQITYAEHAAIKKCGKAIRALPGVTLDDLK